MHFNSTTTNVIQLVVMIHNFSIRLGLLELYTNQNGQFIVIVGKFSRKSKCYENDLFVICQEWGKIGIKHVKMYKIQTRMFIDWY